MNCPRCDAVMAFTKRSQFWRAHFICDGCESAWRLDRGVLVRGRERTRGFAMRDQAGGTDDFSFEGDAEEYSERVKRRRFFEQVIRESVNVRAHRSR